MGGLLTQHWEMLLGRWDGPLAFRLLLQPTVAAILAIRAGVRDARQGRPAYGWRVVTGSGNRRELLRDGWSDVAKLFLAAFTIDVIYELIVYRWIYPGQALIVAAVLAIPSYFLVRGLANRLVRARVHRTSGASPAVGDSVASED